MKIKEAAGQLIDAINPRNIDVRKGTVGTYTTSNLDKQIINVMIALDRLTDPDYTFQGDGIYLVGKHGIAMSSDQEDIITYYNKGQGDETGPFDYYSRDNTLVEIREEGIIEGIILYQVFIINKGDKGDMIDDAYEAEPTELYYGTDHSLFGAGYTKLIHKY